MTDAEELEFRQAAWLIEQRRISPRPPKTVGKLLNRIMTRRGVAEFQARAELVSAWRDVCDPALVNQTQVLAIRHRKLRVRVGNSLVNQQLCFDRQRLLRELQERIPRIHLQGIEFQTGTINQPD